MDRSDAERGLSPVIAFVLLTGIVAVASIGLFVAGGALVDEEADDAEDRRAEHSMVQLGKTIDTVGVGSDSTRRVNLAIPSESDGVVREEDTGRIVVTRYNGTETEVVNRSMGSVVYENGETSYAYEAGAVWRGSGRRTRMVSAPELTYHEETLTLPIPDTSGDTRISSGAVTVRKNRTVAPLNDVEAVRGELITVKITSPYYRGWAEFFRQRVDDVKVQVYPDSETTVINLAEPLIDGDFGTGIVASGDIHADNPSTTPSTEVVTSGDFHGDLSCGDGSGNDCVTEVSDVDVTPIDAAIEVRATAADDNPNVSRPTLTGGETLTAGTYYLTEDSYLINSGDLTLDLGEGDITIVSEGNIALKNSGIRVVNASGDATVRVYMNHTDVAIGNDGGVYVEDGDPARFQLYGTSDMKFAMGQANEHGFTGAIYAPRDGPDGGDNQAVEDNDLNNARCGTDICFSKGSGDVTGAVIGGDVTIEQNTNFAYSSSLDHVTPTMDKGGMFPPPITFLHVAVHEVEVTDDE